MKEQQRKEKREREKEKQEKEILEVSNDPKSTVKSSNLIITFYLLLAELIVYCRA